MLSWWANPQEARGTNDLTIKKIADKHEFSSSSVAMETKKSPARRQYIETLSFGRPRLPHEIIAHIVLLAAQHLREESNSQSDLLRLASIDRASHRAILTRYILPDLKLSGSYQVQALAYDLQKNHLNLQSLAKRVKRLAIRRASLSFTQTYSLFSGAEELSHFEKATFKPLRIILSHCNNLESLSLDFPARILDDRNNHTKTKFGTSLKELITLLSIYGGDLNEALWNPGNSPTSHRWKNLTHLQLHGPRFRMTSLTAIALSHLPSLTNLALIMPLLIHSQQFVSNQAFLRESGSFDQGKDAIGRHNILQILIDRIGHRLKKLLLVCHDVDYYVGNVQKLGPWFRTLHWKSQDDDMRTKYETTQLTLVIARPFTNSRSVPEPTFYSNWMLKRAEMNSHWDWPSGINYDVSDYESVTYNIESWSVPVTFVDTRTSTPEQEEIRARRISNYTAARTRRPVEVEPVENIEESSNSDSSVI